MMGSKSHCTINHTKVVSSPLKWKEEGIRGVTINLTGELWLVLIPSDLPPPLPLPQLAIFLPAPLRKKSK